MHYYYFFFFQGTDKLSRKKKCRRKNSTQLQFMTVKLASWLLYSTRMDACAYNIIIDNLYRLGYCKDRLY